MSGSDNKHYLLITIYKTF